MWPFNKKRQIPLRNSLFCGFTDWHSHILPGVDDGVQTMSEALQILTEYERLGVKDVWLTPHIMEDIPNTTACLRERFSELQSKYQGAITLHLAAENMLDNLFEERLKNDDLLPIAINKDHLLIETSYYNPPIDMENILRCIKAKGYHPILAHPERYIYMSERDYHNLKEMGVKFQLSIPSIVGMYGKDIQKKAKKLHKKGFYNFKGTDLHSYKTLEFLLQNL
ncbi:MULTISPECIES: tyrosine-protein phosphatase [Bacteroides]|uniref:tyrosine-protein phosphatase n=1 Tax=Bacteroides TaxID=816 RepID=UPI000B399828|nr:MULTISPECIES: CpsB/CapC family capsule biosynthesis tyrosine phosphatase [Bacteroides]MBM6944086.1 capsular biosynthesis protein [Bacteroides gallinaceum]OUO62688.1 capsular biosynthesis protein [Bacteroides sp. An279]